MLAGKWRADWRYDWWGNTYGSDLRDHALELETYTATGDQNKAQTLAYNLCTDLGKEQGWHWNTQSLATSLRALVCRASQRPLKRSWPSAIWRSPN